MLSTTISQLWSNAVASTAVLTGENFVPFAQEVGRCVQRFFKIPDDSSLHCYVLKKLAKVATANAAM